MARAGDGYDHMVKLLLIGEAGVGKSSILLRFTEDTFDEAQQATIGVDFKVRTVSVAGKKIKATLWDTAGQERFRTLTSSFYRGAHGILLVYDVTRPETFDALEQWLGEVDHFCAGGGKSVAKLLVGNKADKDDLRAVSFADGEAWARSQGMLFMETSAKTKEGISQAFEEVLEKILETPALLAGTAPARPAGAAAGSTAAGSGAPDVDLDSSASPGGGGCCG